MLELAKAFVTDCASDGNTDADAFIRSLLSRNRLAQTYENVQSARAALHEMGLLSSIPGANYGGLVLKSLSHRTALARVSHDHRRRMDRRY